METLSVPKTISFESYGCDVRTGAWEPYVRAVEAEGVTTGCSPDSVNHVSCKNLRRDEFIDDVGGLAFDTELAGTGALGLPRFIPVLQKSFLWKNPAAIQSHMVGISLADIFTTSMNTIGGRLQAPGRYAFNPRIFESEVFRSKDMVLFMSGRDLLIESLWMEQENLELFESLGKMGFRVAASPNFSAFSGECPLGHRINQKKSLECARLLEAAGVPAIPHVYAMTELHVQNYIAYLQSHPNVRTIFINCTIQRRVPEEVEHIWKVVHRLMQEVGRDLHIIFQGLNVKDGVLFREYGTNLHYAVSTPFHHALARTIDIFDPDLRAIISFGGSNLSQEELAAANIAAYSDFIETLCI